MVVEVLDAHVPCSVGSLATVGRWCARHGPWRWAARRFFQAAYHAEVIRLAFSRSAREIVPHGIYRRVGKGESRKRGGLGWRGAIAAVPEGLASRAVGDGGVLEGVHGLGGDSGGRTVKASPFTKHAFTNTTWNRL